MWTRFRLPLFRTVQVLAAAAMMLSSSIPSWAESPGALGDSIARGAGKTIIEGGTGGATPVPVITTVAFHAERTEGAVTGAFECLALAPPGATGPGSGTFTVNVMYVTGTVKTAVVSGDMVMLTGTATITGIGAGSNIPFTFVAREGGPGSNAVLTTGDLKFNETLVEGQFQIAQSKD